MRHLFYRFSDEAVYYRYFSPIKVMAHRQMQSYVNVDQRRVVSLVGLVGPPAEEANHRGGPLCQGPQFPYAEVAFIVDGGISRFRNCLAHAGNISSTRAGAGIAGFTADVLYTNKSMLRVFEKSGIPMTSTLTEGAYRLTMTFKKSAENRAWPLGPAGDRPGKASET